MSYIAHTPPKTSPHLEPHLEPHEYADHIEEALTYGIPLFEYLLTFSILSLNERETYLNTLKAAIMLHDMGKLDELNQEVFRGAGGRLRVDHIEAGVAVAQTLSNELLAWLIRGHHAPGLPSKKTEKYFIRQLRRELGNTNINLSDTCLRGLRHKRSKDDTSGKEDFIQHYEAIKYTNEHLHDYINRQLFTCGAWPEVDASLPEASIVTRILLSCLVDADHGSAASYSEQKAMPSYSKPSGKWALRLESLNRYISSIAEVKGVSENSTVRNSLRSEFYASCYSGKIYDSRLALCSAPVGLGKTTSIMAYLLRKAILDDASRIFIIAPFSNIIDQTVKKLREALVLDGENKEYIVAAHHHKAEFSDVHMRQYSTLWRAPIIVTTAVQFFETLASANPTKLRKLHSIVGSCIFIDESHACIPAEYFKVTWLWLRQLAHNWGCNVVFSSGSMIEFWNDPYLVGVDKLALPDLFPQCMNHSSRLAELNRVSFQRIDDPMNLDELITRLECEQNSGPHTGHDNSSCLVILNTVQSAAVVAAELSSRIDTGIKSLEERSVLHMSTALAPKDRSRIISEIERRQSMCEWRGKVWYLIATSCVEAGVDLDFGTAFRERCSVTSYLQVAGRVNRHGYRAKSILYDFTILFEDGLTKHPNFVDSIDIFNELWSELSAPGVSLTDISTKAIKKEFSRRPDSLEQSNLLYENESNNNFQEVQAGYKIIKSDTATVIVDEELVQRLERGIPVDWQRIQEQSVQLWINKIASLDLKLITNEKSDKIYSWVDTYEYDPNFLGIMAGLLNPETFFNKTFGVL